MVAELVNRKNGKEQKIYSPPVLALKNAEKCEKIVRAHLYGRPPVWISTWRAKGLYTKPPPGCRGSGLGI